MVAQSHSRFMHWIKWYLLAAVFLGLFGGIQSLCFNIAGGGRAACLFVLHSHMRLLW